MTTARDEALEEAAKVVERMATEPWTPAQEWWRQYPKALSDAAREIRALKEKPNG